MTEPFADILTAGGKANSLGRTNEVIQIVLADKSRLEELYSCLFDDNAWVRMRAADALEKVCREHPEWVEPYIDAFAKDLHQSTQASIQWHLAQIYRHVTVTAAQQQVIITWMTELLSNKDADWIAAANTMDTMMQFVKQGACEAADVIPLLKIQQKHKSNAVIKRANKYLEQLAA